MCSCVVPPRCLHVLSSSTKFFNIFLLISDVSGGDLFMLEFMHMMTKLRPFVHSFLKEASKMFVLYIYTMGDRPYARQMAKLLDPKGEYFGERIISRDDGTVRHQKSLDVVLGQEKAVLILDDTENVSFFCLLCQCFMSFIIMMLLC